MWSSSRRSNVTWWRIVLHCLVNVSVCSIIVSGLINKIFFLIQWAIGYGCKRCLDTHSIKIPYIMLYCIMLVGTADTDWSLSSHSLENRSWHDINITCFYPDNSTQSAIVFVCQSTLNKTSCVWMYVISLFTSHILYSLLWQPSPYELMRDGWLGKVNQPQVLNPCPFNIKSQLFRIWRKKFFKIKIRVNIHLNNTILPLKNNVMNIMTSLFNIYFYHPICYLLDVHMLQIDQSDSFISLNISYEQILKCYSTPCDFLLVL